MANSKITKKSLQALVSEVTKYFLIPPNVEDLLGDFEEILIPTSYLSINSAFRSNIQAVLSTISVPYALAHASALDRNFQRFGASERILALMIERNGEESEEQLNARRSEVAYEKASKKMDEFISSEVGTNVLINDSLSFLCKSLKDETFSNAAKELIQQGLVLSWGAFEVFVRDCFITLLNQHPNMVEFLTKDSTAKKRFELSKISLETLTSHNFDLSKKMGSLLAEQQDLSDLNSIKAIFEALFETNDNLRSALNCSELRMLSQKRHLIVHRRGIIDNQYLKFNNSEQKLGEKLLLAPNHLITHMNGAIKAAAEIMGAISSLQNESDSLNLSA